MDKANRKLKVLNCYCGIGGNRRLWKNVDVIAVEYKEDIARVYQEFYPDDKVIIADAHQYLLDHFKEYDMIWSSPPCPTHSDIRRCGVKKGQYKALYPAMELYQEIILLKHFAECKWVIENVKPYYKSLIAPTQELHRHYFWSNFHIPPYKVVDDRVHCDIVGSSEVYGFNIKDKDIADKRKVLRNMVNPEVGKYILDCAMGKARQDTLI